MAPRIKDIGKGDLSPTAIRIRDNQRRSRARHKEFVEGLQRRLQEYERRGVEATLEMQRAARDVAIENKRLRTLLASLDVTNEEIESFLASFNSPDAPSAPPSQQPQLQSQPRSALPGFVPLPTEPSGPMRLPPQLEDRRRSRRESSLSWSGRPSRTQAQGEGSFQLSQQQQEQRQPSQESLGPAPPTPSSTSTTSSLPKLMVEPLPSLAAMRPAPMELNVASGSVRTPLRLNASRGDDGTRPTRSEFIARIVSPEEAGPVVKIEDSQRLPPISAVPSAGTSMGGGYQTRLPLGMPAAVPRGGTTSPTSSKREVPSPTHMPRSPAAVTS